jgi:hypothetical protein
LPVFGTVGERGEYFNDPGNVDFGALDLGIMKPIDSAKTCSWRGIEV